VSRYLLDTHVLIWWASSPIQLAEKARLAIGDGRSYIVVSAATAWEIAVKQRIGKLSMPHDVMSLIRDNRFIPMPIAIQHAEATQSLPLHHRDPFDRLLVAQAQAEGLTLVTRDRDILKYDVPTLLA
jgi:PIN domain nuclease of toxin-antitoxin system